jgi:hypothetical protein
MNAGQAAVRVAPYQARPGRRVLVALDLADLRGPNCRCGYPGPSGGHGRTSLDHVHDGWFASLQLSPGDMANLREKFTTWPRP